MQMRGSIIIDIFIIQIAESGVAAIISSAFSGFAPAALAIILIPEIMSVNETIPLLAAPPNWFMKG